MIKPLMFCVAVSAATVASAQQQSDYTNAVARFRTFYNAHQADSIYNMFSPRVQTMMPLEKNRGVIGQLQSAMGQLNEYQFMRQDAQVSYFKTVFEKQTVTMLLGLTNDNKIETFRFINYKADTAQTNIVLKTATGVIKGTLTIPDVKEKLPVVLIIAGSGPTDRDGNQVGMLTDTYKQLADSLLKHNIACVRYDKRGIAESISAGRREDSMRIDDYINDAAGFIKMLKKDTRFSKVIVAGHSEGSLVGMVAAGREQADGFISIAGAGFSIDKIIEEQYSAQSPELGSMATKIFDTIGKGNTAHVTNPALTPVFHNSIQPFLRSWMKYDPQKEIKKLNQPVLILQGMRDVQVAVKNAEALHLAAPTSKLVMLETINHVLKPSHPDREKNLATYNEPWRPISGELVTQTVSFVNSIH